MQPVYEGTPIPFNPELHINIRGFPRSKYMVEEVQRMYGAMLLPDTELDLMQQLDRHLFAYRAERGDYPDMLQLPSDNSHYYMPIPFEINFFGAKLQSFKKPAWFRVPRAFKAVAPWRKK